MIYENNDNITNKEEEATAIYQLISELPTPDKRELIGYAKCLHFQTSTNKNSKSDAVHIQ